MRWAVRKVHGLEKRVERFTLLVSVNDDDESGYWLLQYPISLRLFTRQSATLHWVKQHG